MVEHHLTKRGLLPPLKTQVLVVGSGAAGLVAALAAGRNGAEVTLVEYQGFVGGVSSTLTWLGFHDQEYRPVVKGIPLEIVRRLQAAGEAGQFALDPKCSSALSLNTHFYKCLAIDLLKEAGVKLMLHTHVPDEFLAVTTRILGLDPTDVDRLTNAYADVYQQVPEHVRVFRKYIPGFANARLREVAPLLGVRESRRIMGDYVLTGDDVVNGRAFDDVVAMGGYHVDIHRPDGTWVQSTDTQAYDIPFRSLVARGVDGLLVAGKCLSATHEAVASTRVIPICMAQGQAVGTAAALAVKRGVTPRDVPVRELQATLIAQGAEARQTLGEPNWEAIEDVGQLPKQPRRAAPHDGMVDAEPPRVAAEQWIR